MLRFVYQLVILTHFSSPFPLALEKYSLNGCDRAHSNELNACVFVGFGSKLFD